MESRADSYNRTAKFFHWTVALLIFALLSVGFFMTGMDFSPAKLQIYGLHKSFGILILCLAALRLGWRFIRPPPGALASHQKWEKILARIAHVILYAALFAMPLSGWIMSSAGGFPAGFFGLFELPVLVAKNKDLFEFMQEVHETLAHVIVGVVALHMAGAVKHHVIDRDETLKRMTSSHLDFKGGIVLSIVLVILLALPLFLEEVSGERSKIESHHDDNEAEVLQDREDHHGDWLIQHERSHVDFEVMQYGVPFTGTFERFDGRIEFDPEDLAHARAEIDIDVTSIKTGSDERDAQAFSDEWFDGEQFPDAKFFSRDFERLGTNRYVAKGYLTIRGVKLPVDLPFILNFMSDKIGITYAEMEADITLNRLDFGIGQGVWQSTEPIGNAVKISIQLEAVQNTNPPH